MSPNPYSTEIFKRAFAYQGTVLETGYPRNDLLVKTTKDESTKNMIKEKLDLPEDKKLILYAPTWREKKRDKMVNTPLLLIFLLMT